MSTRPYRPANGTEGAIFDDLWCSQCQADAGWRNGTEEHCCDIFTRTMIYDVDEPGYPVEWVEDDPPKEGYDTARCTAFVPIGDESPPCKSQTPGAEPGANSLCKSGDGGQSSEVNAEELTEKLLGCFSSYTFLSSVQSQQFLHELENALDAEYRRGVEEAICIADERQGELEI